MSFDHRDKLIPGILTQDSYQVARDAAADEFRLCDLEQQAGRCEARVADLGGRMAVDLLFFGQPVRILPDEGVVVDAESNELELWDQIVVLHFLSYRKSISMASDTLVSFREIPDGSFFHAAFQQQVCRRLARVFGANPPGLLEAGRALGGEIASLGDASVVLPAFALVPVTCIVYAGDEDFPAEANVLFREDISCRLPTEDIAVLGSLAVSRLEVAAKNPKI